MLIFNEVIFEYQISALVIDSVINFHSLNDQRFFCSQLELSDDEEKYFVSIYQAEIKLSENNKIYFFYLEGQNSPQPFQFILVGSEIEKLFLFLLNLEEEKSEICLLQRKDFKNELTWSSVGIEEQLEIALLISKIDRGPFSLQPTDFKRNEFLVLAKNYLINYLNR